MSAFQNNDDGTITLITCRYLWNKDGDVLMKHTADKFIQLQKVNGMNAAVLKQQIKDSEPYPVEIVLLEPGMRISV